MIPALGNLSLSILHTNKAAAVCIDARADTHVSCSYCCLMLLISLPARLASLFSLVPLGTIKFLYFQVGLSVKQYITMKGKGWFLPTIHLDCQSSIIQYMCLR